MRRVLVIVVTYNGMHWLDRCLSSVAGDADLYVFDNDSRDGSADFVAEHYPDACLVRNNSNLGFAAGNNAGFKYALQKGYDAVYLLNQDAWLLPGTLERLLDYMDSHPEYGILSPMQMQADGVSYNKAFGRDVLPVAGKESGGIREVPFVMAAHWLVSRACLEKVGLFASLFSHFGNDDNYCHRVLWHGMHIGIVPSLAVIHDHTERKKTVQQLVYQNYTMGSLVRLCDIRKPLMTGLLWLVPYTVIKAVRYGSFLPFAKFWTVIGKLSQVRSVCKLTRLPGVREV